MSPFCQPTAVLLAFGTILYGTLSANAGETEFLSTLAGKWQGSGIVKVRTSAPGISVDCTFDSITGDRSFSLDGICRAFVVVRKRISANLRISDGEYSGTYHGARTGPAQLAGSRRGNDVALKIGWAGIVNGDQMAQMNIRRRGDNRLVLEISDTDPASGKSQITSRIELARKAAK